MTFMFFRENLRCLSIRKNHLETCYEIGENKQIVRDSWMHEKVNFSSLKNYFNLENYR